jgi:hypothetical protein
VLKAAPAAVPAAGQQYSSNSSARVVRGRLDVLAAAACMQEHIHSSYVESLPALYCTVLHCTVLYCTTLYCSALHCTVLLDFLFCPAGNGCCPAGNGCCTAGNGYRQAATDELLLMVRQTAELIGPYFMASGEKGLGLKAAGCVEDSQRIPGVLQLRVFMCRVCV